MRHAEELLAALRGTGGALPEPGVLHVVAVPRFDPGVTSLRAALVLAAADVVRRPTELTAGVLAPLIAGEVVAGSLEEFEPADLGHGGRVVVQLVPTAVQTAQHTVREVRRLRAAGIPVELVASTGEVDAALVAAGIGPGVARAPDDGRLGTDVLAADRPDLGAWRRLLLARGLLPGTPVALVAAAGTPDQRARTVPLDELGADEVPGPVLAVVGDGVEGPEDWRDRLPLRGLVVANLRAPHQAPALTARCRTLGAEVLEAPLLDIAPGDAAGMDTAVRSLADGTHDLLALTSPNGVRALAGALVAAGLDARALAGVGTIACVGPGTAATLTRELAVTADLVADVSTTEGLADAVGAPAGPGRSALLPRADLATPLLAQRLGAAGWDVHEVTAYRTVRRRLAPEVAAALGEGRVDLVPVLSSSMADALVASARGVRGAVVSIGPVTSATLRRHGVEPAAEAAPHDLDGLVSCLEAHGHGEAP